MCQSNDQSVWYLQEQDITNKFWWVTKSIEKQPALSFSGGGLGTPNWY